MEPAPLFTGSGSVYFGLNKDEPINLTLDFGVGVPDPNSGVLFWNQPHQWLIADDPAGWNSVWYEYQVGTFTQGSFSFGLDGPVKHFYAYYTPVPEPGAFMLWAAGSSMLLSKRFRKRKLTS